MGSLVVYVNKRDLVDEETSQLVELEVQELLEEVVGWKGWGWGWWRRQGGRWWRRWWGEEGGGGGGGEGRVGDGGGGGGVKRVGVGVV